MRIACAALAVLLVLLAACHGQENGQTETALVDTTATSSTSASATLPATAAGGDTTAPLVGHEYAADLPQFDIDALVHQGRAFVIPNGKLDPVGVLIRSYEDPRRTGGRNPLLYLHA